MLTVILTFFEDALFVVLGEPPEENVQFLMGYKREYRDARGINHVATVKGSDRRSATSGEWK